MRLYLAASVLALSGCFNPQISSGGFACDPPDHAQCPQGFSCVNKLCVDDSQAIDVPSQDLSFAGDLASHPLINPSTAPRPADMAVPPDLAHSDKADLSPLHDLAQPMCVATGGDCTYHQDAVCCSNYCIYSTNKCK